jgi:hypothetical protein
VRGEAEPDALGFEEVAGGGITMRAPRRGRRIRTGDLTRGMDVCEVWLEARTVTATESGGVSGAS